MSAVIEESAAARRRHGLRPLRILRALAASEIPLTTEDLVARLDEGFAAGSPVRSWYAEVLRRHERNGRAERVGRTTGGRRAGPSCLWRVTEDGLKWLAGREAEAGT